MKKVEGRHGGMLYAMEKGDTSPNKGKRKNAPQVKDKVPRTQHKG